MSFGTGPKPLRSQIGSIFRRRPTTGKSNASIVIDHDIYNERGHCDKCSGVQQNHVCGHAYIVDGRMCGKHSGLPLGKPVINFTPTMQAIDAPCNNCIAKASNEAELAFHNKYRSMSEKKWRKEESRENFMLTEMERVRQMTPEDWEAEKLERQGQLKKKKGIVKLSPFQYVDSDERMLSQTLPSHNAKSYK
ncbi:hypothetical protein M7I_3293 [Glarea lozoyensis 74030]|uniref:Uncharacterized protein n=1 Tax=Glarea lozoyensis (strain ATCC 74030 / MF5533) TaxID=1104152 RepID=H0EKN8_GLAL7|nr:hypothetical protein M7I_3293 [Glarea lozoyensis 74030]